MTKSLLSAAVLTLSPAPKAVAPASLSLQQPCAVSPALSAAAAPSLTLSAAPALSAAPVAAAMAEAKPASIAPILAAAPALAKAETAESALSGLFGETVRPAAMASIFSGFNFGGGSGASGGSRQERANAVEAKHNAAANRFELEFEGHEGEMTYRVHPRDGTLFIDHTGVPDAIGGLGLAKKLAAKAVEVAREKGVYIVPACPFMAKYMVEHPETHDRVHPKVREQLGLPPTAEMLAQREAQRAARETLRPKAEAAQASHDAAGGRFEITVDGQTALMQYQVAPDGTVVVVHTETPEALGGLGLAKKLGAAAVAWARAEGKKIFPQCQFMAKYMYENASTHDVLHPQAKKAFGL